MWQRRGTPEVTVWPSTPASRPGQVYYYHGHLDPSLALCPVESFSVSCLWTNKAPHVVGGLFRETKDSLPASLRNFWGTSHRPKVKPNVKLNPHQSATSCSADHFCARDSEKPHSHVERQRDPGDLPRQGKSKLISSENYQASCFSYLWTKFRDVRLSPILPWYSQASRCCVLNIY